MVYITLVPVQRYLMYGDIHSNKNLQ